MTPNQIYQLDVERVISDLGEIFNEDLERIPGTGVFASCLWDREDPDIEVRVHRHVDFDVLLFWELSSLWFQGRPVMITQSAGREGRDHVRHFPTDLVAFRAVRARVWEHIWRHDLSLTPMQIDANVARDDLLSFYGNSYHDFR